jgi:hypothetical protein
MLLFFGLLDAVCPPIARRRRSEGACPVVDGSIVEQPVVSSPFEH